MTAITMAPVLFHWPESQWRDFYARIADEAPVDTVYVGEVVCAKRAPFYAPLYPEVMARLVRGGKKVVLSTLAQVMNRIDRKTVAGLCECDDVLIEINDISALAHISAGRSFAAGPFVNVYNEGTLRHLAGLGATHVTLPPEMPESALIVMEQAARTLGVTLEIQAYGRVPLALSARCYHARALGRTKDSCQYACAQDPDGMDLDTLDGTPFLSVNGIQTLSHTCLNLVRDVPRIQEIGLSAIRLSPHAHDMVAVSRIFRDVLDGRATPEQAEETLKILWPDAVFSNGFFHKQEGYRFVA